MSLLIDILFDIRVASLLISIFIPAIFYWHSLRVLSYWKNKGVATATSYPIVGSFWAAFKKNMDDVEVDRYKKYGKLFGIFEGHNPMLVVAEPELVRNILVKDFHYFSSRRDLDTGDPIFNKMMSLINGEDWKRVRSIVSPTFSTGKIKKLISIFQDCSQTVVENINDSKDNDYILDILKIYGGFTIDVIASSAFSTKLDSHKDPDNEFVKHAKAAFSQKLGLRFLLFVFMPRVLRALKIPLMDPRHMQFFQNVTLEIIKERRRTGQKRNDFLQLLLDAADEVSKENKQEEKSEDVLTNYGGDDSSNHAIFKTITSKTLSMDELVAQCVIFFIAGYHTTATTLGITSYFLAVNQDVQEKAFKEMKEVLAETDGKLTYEAIQKMKYLDNIISETLRIYAPAIRLDRTAVADYELGDTGITIPKGMVVGIPIFAMHRDPKFFPDPEKFNPDRFSPEEREKQIPYTYLPFGAGPRNCVGMRFALVEIKVCLVHVLCNFHVKTCSQTKIPLEFNQNSGILLPRAVTVQMEPRKDCPLKY